MGGASVRNTRPYICNDCKWYKSTVIKCCLENAIKMHNCTFTQGTRLNNNENLGILSFLGSTCILNAGYCIVLTLWMTFFILPLIRPLLPSSSCLKRNNHRSAVLTPLPSLEMVSWYYHSSPSSCILLLCSMDQSVSPVMLLPAQSILDSAYINTQCLTNRLRSFNWITRSAAFPLVRLGGSGHGADSPPLPERGIWFAILPNDLQMPDVSLVEWRWHGCLLVHDSVIRVGAKSTVRALKCLLWSGGD